MLMKKILIDTALLSFINIFVNGQRRIASPSKLKEYKIDTKC